MPFKSKAQSRLMFAASKKPGGIKGLSQETAKKFIKDTKHQKIGKLPEHVKFPKLRKLFNK